MMGVGLFLAAWVASAAPVGETTVRAPAESSALPRERATTTVRAADMARRLPRSAPDALRFEPGAFIQQTAHGQASVYLRGLTGQQTVLMLDGVRLNTSTWRQGPNQYFFTLDAQMLDSIELLRGGASTRFGADALGGVIFARPIEVTPGGEGAGAWWRPSVRARGGSADWERGVRFQLEGATGPFGFVGGVGGRQLDLLRGGGVVRSPATGAPADVPRLAPDGATQLGTGFAEFSADARLVAKLADNHRLTAAVYAYRQLDAPRTDQCPPALSRIDECLLYEEQFRTLAYAAWSGEGMGAAFDRARLTLSYQQQHERRRTNRPASFIELLGRDDVHTAGLSFQAQAKPLLFENWGQLQVDFGAEAYTDFVDSVGFVRFTDVDITVAERRGQYVAGSRYLTGGVFADAEFRFAKTARAFGGARAALAGARVPGESATGTQAVAQTWGAFVGHAGVEWMPRGGPVALSVHFDRSFRAPNLDDLSSRQQTGPGFQFENPALRPEVAHTLDVGARWRQLGVDAAVWLFQTWLVDSMNRVPKEQAECPPQTPACNGSRVRFSLENALGVSELRGAEAMVAVQLPLGFRARTTLAWTYGRGPNPVDASLGWVPLSRVPPLNGTVELDWSRAGFSLGGALRWAGLQNRLALSDFSDARIPAGGTPGYAVADLRASYRWGRRLALSAVLENLLDAPYRAHGSSVNGPGRSVVVSIETAPW